MFNRGIDVAGKKTSRGVRRKKDKIGTTIKNEIIGILIIGLACLGFVLLYANNGSVFAATAVKILRTLAGDGSAGIFIVLAAVGISLMGKSQRVRKMRIIGIFLLWLVFEGFIHLTAADNYQSGALFALGRAGQGGGLLGAGLIAIFVPFFGITGAYILLAVLAAIGSVLAINRSLVHTITDLFFLLAAGCRGIARQLKEFIKVLADGEKQRKEKRTKNISSIYKKEQARRIPDYYVQSSPEDLIVNYAEEPTEQKNVPLSGIPEENTMTAKKQEKPDFIAVENKKAPLGKLTSTPISRKTERNENYMLPPLSLVPKAARRGTRSNKYLADNVKLLEDTLASFGVRVKVTRVTQGPAITRYELQPAPGVKVSKITSLADDIALSLAASDVRIEAPIPGKSAVGIEVPNREIALVHFREVLESEDFQNSQSKLSLALGKDITGNPIIGDLTKMPHLLIAGATGSGKSVCINTIIGSIVFKAKPDEVKLLLIDPKMVELTNYNGIPHLISPVVTEPQKAAGALKWIVTEMETRYELFASAGVRDIVRYNYIIEEKKEKGEKEDKEGKTLPYVVVIIDELADLMMVAPGEVEEAICRLAQMARAAGIHLIVATQRPSVDVITGLIKANIPSRIAFAVSSQIDSRTILDMSGAEKLLGRGDMLYHPIGINKPLRVQGCFLADKEVKNIVDYLISEAKPEYFEIPEISQQAAQNDDPGDELFYKAAYVFFENNTASVSLLQRRLRIGYTRAARIMDLLEEKGVVGQYEGSKPREILMSKGQFDLKFGKVDEL
jgi:S-DNA-T family DNA segregation ATPase FtsK/SpoIIIE